MTYPTAAAAAALEDEKKRLYTFKKIRREVLNVFLLRHLDVADLINYTLAYPSITEEIKFDYPKELATAFARLISDDYRPIPFVESEDILHLRPSVQAILDMAHRIQHSDLQFYIRGFY